jgi:hypothetical protein
MKRVSSAQVRNSFQKSFAFFTVMPVKTGIQMGG